MLARVHFWMQDLYTKLVVPDRERERCRAFQVDACADKLG